MPDPEFSGGLLEGQTPAPTMIEYSGGLLEGQAAAPTFPEYSGALLEGWCATPTPPPAPPASWTKPWTIALSVPFEKFRPVRRQRRRK
jgi:hypothetical protein